MEETAPARRVGKYELLSLLGKGGMGEVWKARDAQLGRVVALKLLQRTTIHDLARFRREAQAAGRLSHPHIAPLHEFSADPPFLAMQFVEGVPLHLAPGADPMRVRVTALRDAALAVQFAHEQGVLHRDLKPANILVDAAGRAFVLDFGLAREVQPDVTAMTATGDVLGTPSYMAPEQARGDVRAHDARTDVYGLGATLYHVLTHRAPHQGETAYEVLKRAVEEDPPTPRSVNPRGPWELNVIAMRALAREPARRFPSAKEFAADLSRFLAGEPILAKPTSRFYRAGKKVRKNPWAWTAGALAALAVAALAFFSLHGAAERRARARAQPFLEAGRRSLEEALLLTRTVDADWNAVAARTGGAIDQFTRALEENPAGTEAALLRGRARFLLGDLAGAGADLSRADSPEAHVDRARLLLRMREREVGAPFAFYHDDQLMRIVLPPETPRSTDLERRAKAEIAAAPMGSRDAEVLHGVVEFLDGNFTVAETTLSRAVEDDPFDADALYYRALTRLGTANVPDAIPDLERVLRIRPTMTEAMIAMAGAQLMRSAIPEGMAWADRAIALRPDLSEAYRARGDLHREAGRAEDALADYARALEIDDGNLMARLGRYLTRRDADDAAADLDEVIRRSPEMSVAYVERADWKRNHGDLAGADGDLTRALEIEPEYRDALLLREWVRAKLGRYLEAVDDGVAGVNLSGRETAAYDMPLSMGEQLAYSRAIDENVQAHPRDPLAYLRRAWNRYNGHRPGVLADVNQALERNPDLALAWMLKGTTLCESANSTEEVEEAFRRAVELEPRWAGQAYAELGVHYAFYVPHGARTALLFFENALRINPYDSRTLFHCAHANRLLDEDSAAMSLHVRATYFYTWSLAHGQIPRLFYRIGGTPQDWSHLLAVVSKPVYLIEARAMYEGERERFDEAITLCDEGLAGDPPPYSRRILLRTRARLLMEMRRCPEAIGDFENALSLAEGHVLMGTSTPEIHFYLAEALRGAGRFADAAVHYVASGAQDPETAFRIRWVKARAEGRECLCGTADEEYTLARMLISDHTWGDALDALRAAMEGRPGVEERWNDLLLRGRILGRLDRWEEAVADFRGAALLKGDDLTARLEEGDALVRLGRWDEAERAFQAAYDIDPDHPLAHAGFARIALHRGDLALAERELRLYSRAEPFIEPTGLLDPPPDPDVLLREFEQAAGRPFRR